ncbi:SWIM zinc finger family protein [Halorhabdus amylolytica]|uniref:SWIM zinc finger family protein n=1 Tax=Halorhabdus amylolytica TaxID=2559573 RepID=UPI0010AB3696|nr:SWIM zinc finger family protein [Halorhabdus amylolytica]
MTDIDHSVRDDRVPLAPDPRSMDERAARAWTEPMAVRSIGDGRYAVDSASGATYVVDLPGQTCTCPDHEIRKQRCKHLRRVALEVTLGRVSPPGQRRVACDACGTETFVPEDAPNPQLCPHCRLEPGDRVVDRETGDWLHVVDVQSDTAEGVWLPDADCTVAEYPTNRAYPGDDPVVEAVYVGDVARETQPKRYAFPLSRLERRQVETRSAAEGDERPTTSMLGDGSNDESPLALE